MKKIYLLFALVLIFGCKKNETLEVVKPTNPGSQTSNTNVLTNYSGNLPATDALGRVLPTNKEVGGPKNGKYVGLFYWTWHTNFANNIPYNTSEILAKDPSAIDNYNSPSWPVSGGTYFWNQPLFGYYRDTDDWVLRKHAEMLADAGVDAIFFDCTNGSFTWQESYMELCKVFEQARKDGVKTPQIVFMLAFSPTDGSLAAIKDIYNNLYKPGLYSDLWFKWKGKPLIMGYPDNLTDVAGDPIETALRKEIRNFFTFRPGQPAYNTGPSRNDQWGWLEICPQHGYVDNGYGGYEQVTVGVAQNWSSARGLTAMNAPNAFGRSYTNGSGQNNQPDAELYGYNFQEQWDRAIALNPEFIFITGWNEWIAGRYELWQQQPNAFPDEFSTERSRDIEPMKGGHGDNYYYQMVKNIRRFKGVKPEATASAAKTIQIDGQFDDWSGVLPEFRSHKGSTIHRDSPGWQGCYYTNETGRNDIVLSKVARDASNIYFYVETVDAITAVTDKNWMRLFIDIDRKKSTGWEGYDFVINRVSPGNTAILEKSESGWNWNKVGEVEYVVKGNKMELKVPRTLLGIPNAIDLEFKWSDNMQEDGNIMDFLVNGDVAPAGRFNFHFFASN